MLLDVVLKEAENEGLVFQAALTGNAKLFKVGYLSRASAKARARARGWGYIGLGLRLGQWLGHGL